MDRPGEKVAAIVLAAGKSSRMGRPKQLLPFSGDILAGQVVDAALKARVSSVALVLGYRANEIRDALRERIEAHPRLTVVLNRDFDRGMSTSIIAGLSAVEAAHDHAMILLGDMPFIRAKAMDDLLTRYLASGLPMGAVKLRNGFGHPVVFHRSLYPELHRLTGDVGARPILEKYRQNVLLVEPTGAYDHQDIDTVEDYARAEKKSSL
ncbi:MAG: nucleotidyltransferase family protein [Deltaproteobacteria bacterium]|nr:nucleotidyltransferase family protein [Deltaproteobacteria bacterium]